MFYRRTRFYHQANTYRHHERKSEGLNLLLENNANLTQSDLDLIVFQNECYGAAVLGIILEARPGLTITDNTTRESAQNYSAGVLSYVLTNYDLMSRTLLEAIPQICPIIGSDDDLL